MRIIDARARPPIDAFVHDPYANLESTVADLRRRGWAPTPANQTADLSVYLDELRAAGIERVGIPARVDNAMYGGADTERVLAACREQPEFFGYAAVDPFSAGAPDAVAELGRAGAKAIVVEPGI